MLGYDFLLLITIDRQVTIFETNEKPSEKCNMRIIIAIIDKTHNFCKIIV